MRARHKVSRAGVELIKSFEGLRQKATRLVDGRWSIGYGHTYSAREGASVTAEDADALLRFDLLPVVEALNNLVHTPINQNQFDALVSFVFNIGIENFITSDVLRRINEGRITEAALAMDNWTSADYNGQTYVLAPLVRRRAAEKNLFLTPDEGGVEIDADMIAPGAIRPSMPAPTAPVVTPSVAETPAPHDIYAARKQADQEAALQAEYLRLEAQKRDEAQRLEHLRLAEEKRIREEVLRREEKLREETLRQAQALAAARLAEEARIEALRRQEAERVERERAERERLEAETRLRLEQETRERLAAEADAQAREQAEAAQKEEAARKAEAAAALMRLYSPYANMGGTLVRLHTDGENQGPVPAMTVPAPPSAPPLVAPAFELSAEPLAETPSEARSDAPEPSDTEATTPVQATPHWREQLQHPLPGQPAPVAPQLAEGPPPERTSLMADYVPSLSDAPASVFEGDDEWTTEDGRVALSAEDSRDDGNGMWRIFSSTLVWIISSVVGLAALGGATAAYYQSRSNVNIGQGQSEQFTVISSVLAVIGIICVCVSVYLILKRLGGLKD